MSRVPDVPGNPDPTRAPTYRGKLLTVDQVRELLGDAVSKDWIYRNFKVGRVKLSHRCVRWKEYDILEWLEETAA